MLTPDQVAALLDMALDLGLLRPPVRHPDIEVRVLRREPLVAVLPQTIRSPPGLPCAWRRSVTSRSSPGSAWLNQDQNSFHADPSVQASHVSAIRPSRM